MPSTEFRPPEEMLELVVREASARRARRRRRRQVLASTMAVLMVVALVSGLALARSDRRDGSVETDRAGGTSTSLEIARTTGLGPEATSTTLTRPPLREPEGWSPMAPSPLSARVSPLSVWTGQELIVIWGEVSVSGCRLDGGSTVCDGPPADRAAAYHPVTDSWRPIAPPPISAEPDGSVRAYRLVWDGREAILWGGAEASGAAYDPVNDRWRTLAPAPLAARRGFIMTWTGSEVLVWGGVPYGSLDGEGLAPFDEGAAYDPVADRWRPIGASGRERSAQLGVWADGHLVVLGGVDLAGRPKRILEVQAFDPATDRWEARASAPFEVAAAVWTGTEVVVQGWARLQGDEADVPPESSPVLAAYDPKADRWRELARPPLEAATYVSDVDLVWTGRDILLRTVAESAGYHQAVVACDPSSGAWRPLPVGELSARHGSAVSWTGTELLVWGGNEGVGFTSDGARYRPGSGH